MQIRRSRGGSGRTHSESGANPSHVITRAILDNSIWSEKSHKVLFGLGTNRADGCAIDVQYCPLSVSGLFPIAPAQPLSSLLRGQASLIARIDTVDLCH